MSDKKRVFSAGRWTVLSALIRSALTILQLTILARLLSPDDFGLMAITGSILAIVILFSDLGLSRAIIHFDNLTENTLSSLYWLNLLMGLVLSLLFAAAAPLMGGLFKLEGLTILLLSISPCFLLMAFGQQYCALAEKKLNFIVLSINETIAAICGFIAAIIIALNHGGVYALVAGMLINISTNSLLAWLRLSKDYPLRWHLNIQETLPFLRYGSYIVGESLLNTIQRQADIFVASFFASPALLGLYSMPRDFCFKVGMTINPIITRIGFPLMSRHQQDVAALKSIYLQTLRMTSSLNFPLYFVLGVFAQELVLLLFGAQWKDAAIYMQLLAIWGAFRSVGNPVGSLLHAIGAVRQAFWWNVCMLLLLPICYWLGAYYFGLVGLSLTLVLAHIILLPLTWWFLVRPLCHVGFVEYLAKITTPFVLSVVSGLIAWLMVIDLTHSILRLFVGGFVFGCCYLLLSRYFNRAWFDAILLLLKGFLIKDHQEAKG